jgi:hypothetical protein
MSFNVLKLIKREFEHASFDFYKFKDEINDLLREGKRKGYDDCIYCDLTISAVPRQRFEAEIRLFYKTTTTDKAYRMVRKLELDEINDIPDKIEAALLKDGTVKIKIDNILGLSLIAGEEIDRAVKFEQLFSTSKFLEKKFTLDTEPVERRIKIKDELFFTQVTYLYISKTKEKRKVFNYSKILNLPLDIAQKIEASEDATCTISA